MQNQTLLTLKCMDLHILILSLISYWFNANSGHFDFMKSNVDKDGQKQILQLLEFERAQAIPIGF